RHGVVLVVTQQHRELLFAFDVELDDVVAAPGAREHGLQGVGRHGQRLGRQLLAIGDSGDLTLATQTARDTLAAFVAAIGTDFDRFHCFYYLWWFSGETAHPPLLSSSNEERAHRITVVDAPDGLAEQAGDRDVADFLAGPRLG